MEQVLEIPPFQASVHTSTDFLSCLLQQVPPVPPHTCLLSYKGQNLHSGSTLLQIKKSSEKDLNWVKEKRR